MRASAASNVTKGRLAVPMAVAAGLDRGFDALQGSTDPIVGQETRSASAMAGRIHSHARAQLIWSVTVRATVDAGARSWTLLPGQALWIPGGKEHRVHSRDGPVFRSLYVRPDLASALPARSGDVPMTPFLGELVRRLVDIYEGRAGATTYPHLVGLLLNEIGGSKHAAPPTPDMPRDARLVRICHALVERPGDRRTLADWGRTTGASCRTLERLFREETGLTFVVWRQQCRALAAIPLLEADWPVQKVAWLSGYDSQSAFAAMFRKVTGAPPGAFRP